MVNEALIYTFLGIAIGGLITWWVTRKYYRSAANDLKQEAEELRKLNYLILRSLEAAGLIEFNKDEEGKPKFVHFRLNAEPGIYKLSPAAAELLKNNKNNKHNGVE